VASEHLLAWLASRPEVDLHSVVWTAGPRGTKPYEVGRLHDVGAVRRRLLPLRLSRVGLQRIGGGLMGRSVRATLRDVPGGILYLSSGFAGAALRYLPNGDRVVLTHLHAIDRLADPPLSGGDIARLRAATTHWLATDDETRIWAAATWGLEAGAITIVPAPVDPLAWSRPRHRPNPEVLRLGVAGASWLRIDHTPRIVQAVGARRPDLALDLVWSQAVIDPGHLAPMRHDLHELGLADRLRLPTSTGGPMATLDDLDVLVLSSPDDEAPWVAWEAAARGIPMACFDTHRAASAVVAGGGVVVPYADIEAIAEAVIDAHEDDGAPSAATTSARRIALRDRDVAVVGPMLMAIATHGTAS